jgi:peptide/nickel transport system substrate-binding protein
MTPRRLPALGWRVAAALLGALLVVVGPGARAVETTLRIGLAEDPDALDPTLSRTFVGRMVFAALCDKLFDVDANLAIVPQLAAGYQWSADMKALTVSLRRDVVFHDGTPLDADAVKYSLERHQKFPGSTRVAELSAVSSVDVVDAATVRLNLARPFAPLLSQLSDRAGMIVSPRAAAARGDQFAGAPVCAGPYRFVQRVAQDRIVLKRFERYWDSARIHIDTIVFVPIPDDAVRLTNLRAGSLDLIERVAPTDLPTIAGDPKLRHAAVTELGYSGLTINVANGALAERPLGRDRRVRRALELALDRDVISQVVYGGEWRAGNQALPPSSPYHVKSLPVPARDVAGAKALLQEAGEPHPKFTLTVANNPIAIQVGQVIQRMAGEAGFDVVLETLEFATSLERARKGEFQAIYLIWSGRADPDGNLYNFVACKGPLNDGRYCEATVDRELDAARTALDPAERRAHYTAATERLLADLPIIYLLHRKWIYAYGARLTGFQPHPDGLIRPQDLRLP